MPKNETKERTGGSRTLDASGKVIRETEPTKPPARRVVPSKKKFVKKEGTENAG